MAISLRHLFQSAKSDGPDTTLVQPSNWNAEHQLTMATLRLLGRTTAGTGAVEEISVGSDLSLAAGVLNLSSTPTTTSITLGGGVRIENSGDRSGLLEVNNLAGTYAGMQAVYGGTQFWSFLGNATAAGIYDDTGSKWHVRGVVDGTTELYYNGNLRLETTSTGIAVTSGIAAGGAISAVGAISSDANVSGLRLRATGSADVTLDSTTHPFQIGFSSGTNIVADTNEIQARNDGAVSQLNFNLLGGDVLIGNSSSLVRTPGKFLSGTTDTTLGTANSSSSKGVYQSDGILIAANHDEYAGVFNRMGPDGTIIVLRAQGVSEGTIAVSGTTVSFNGGHLSRWSRLMTGDTSELLKGTVMSNLDDMIVWGSEENEQLNHTKVSDVEGDPNVAGVFVGYDTEDNNDDFFLAMTGDMVIRIASGTTVARGDLLMSAGDGTAKPQADDIVRSKTIAKVTSTHVSHTYPDGSYCVPCVLMAC